MSNATYVVLLFTYIFIAICSARQKKSRDLKEPSFKYCPWLTYYSNGCYEEKDEIGFQLITKLKRFIMKALKTHFSSTACNCDYIYYKYTNIKKLSTKPNNYIALNTA